MFDRAKSTAIRKGLNMMLNGRYGEIQSLDLETKDQRLDLQIQLNGESDLVDISVGRYEIDEQDPGQPVVVLNDIRISRQWMQELATDNIEGQTIDIPANFTPLVKMIL